MCRKPGKHPVDDNLVNSVPAQRKRAFFSIFISSRVRVPAVFQRFFTSRKHTPRKRLRTSSAAALVKQGLGKIRACFGRICRYGYIERLQRACDFGLRRLCLLMNTGMDRHVTAKFNHFQRRCLAVTDFGCHHRKPLAAFNQENTRGCHLRRVQHIASFSLKQAFGQPKLVGQQCASLLFSFFVGLHAALGGINCLAVKIADVIEKLFYVFASFNVLEIKIDTIYAAITSTHRVFNLCLLLRSNQTLCINSRGRTRLVNICAACPNRPVCVEERHLARCIANNCLVWHRCARSIDNRIRLRRKHSVTPGSSSIFKTCLAFWRQ